MKTNKKILVIDDETAIRKFLRVGLENAGYEVAEEKNAQDGIRELIGFRPDLVILDLGLPDRDGLEVISKIREWSQIPIIVLTVKEDEEIKVAALDNGADDYLTKPFSMPELLARLRAGLRHSSLQKDSPLFKSGPLEVDLEGRLVTVYNQEIHLTSTEFDILRLLIKHVGKVVTHRQMLKEIWGPNAVEHTQYLRVYVGHLRKKLETDESIKLIVTEAGVGYRLLLI